MELRDILALSVSALALIVSAIAVWTSLRRGTLEKQRTIKSEITATLRQIVTLRLNFMKIFHEAANDAPYLQSVSQVIAQENAFLMQQAAYLIEQVPGLVTAVEYNTLATAMVDVGDFDGAGTFFQKAIDASFNNYYRSMATRSLAYFLFSQHRFDEGRQQYEKAIALLPVQSNQVHYTNGTTYQQWAWNELYVANSPERSERLIATARAEFSAIDNPLIQSNALKMLETALMNPQVQPTPSLTPKPTI
jgi:tetratricopeptide (TPR) repeat protein